jgi:hypothetical protein
MAPVFDASVYGHTIADVYDDLYEATTIDTSTTEWAPTGTEPSFTGAGRTHVSLYRL